MLKFWGNVWAIVVALIIMLILLIGYAAIEYSVWKSRIISNITSDKTKLEKYQQSLLKDFKSKASN